jgi:methylthioribose-1-phosphate isomerase
MIKKRSEPLKMFKTVEWKNNAVVMIDQRVLPEREVYNTYRDYKGVAGAIKDMVVRGAPAIGVAAAMGVALGALNIKALDMTAFKKEFDKVAKLRASTRPTAVNLFWAMRRMKRVASKRWAQVEALKKLVARPGRYTGTTPR